MTHLRKLILRLLRRLGLFDQRPKTRMVRALVASARGDRIRAAASRERIGPDEVEDALTVMACEHQVTFDEALSMVEARGLSKAVAELERVTGE